MSTRPWTAAATGWSRLPRDARDTLFLVAVSAWTIAPHLAHRPAWFGLGVAALLVWRVHLTLTRRPLPGRWTVVALLALSAAATAWHQSTLLGREAGVSLLVVLMALKTLELRARRDAVVLLPRLTIRDLIALMGRVSCVIGADTGLVHIAASRGLPVAAVFRATDAQALGPDQWAARAISPQADAPDLLVSIEALLSDSSPTLPNT